MIDVCFLGFCIIFVICVVWGLYASEIFWINLTKKCDECGRKAKLVGRIHICKHCDKDIDEKKMQEEIDAVVEKYKKGVKDDNSC